MWSLVVCCLVAATTARDPVDDGYRASAVVRTAQTATSSSARAAARTVTADHRGPIDHQLPPSLAAHDWKLGAPDTRVLSTIAVVHARPLTHACSPGSSARGPPIA